MEIQNIDKKPIRNTTIVQIHVTQLENDNWPQGKLENFNLYPTISIVYFLNPTQPNTELKLIYSPHFDYLYNFICTTILQYRTMLYQIFCCRFNDFWLSKDNTTCKTWTTQNDTTCTVHGVTSKFWSTSEIHCTENLYNFISNTTKITTKLSLPNFSGIFQWLVYVYAIHSSNALNCLTSVLNTPELFSNTLCRLCLYIWKHFDLIYARQSFKQKHSPNFLHGASVQSIHLKVMSIQDLLQKRFVQTKSELYEPNPSSTFPCKRFLLNSDIVTAP